MDTKAISDAISEKKNNPDYLLLGDSSGSCPPCDILKEKLKAKLEDGTVRFVDVNSEEGMALVKDKDTTQLPQAYRTEDGSECEIFLDEETVLVKCGDSDLIAIVEPETKAG